MEPAMAPAEVTGRKPEVTGYKSGSRAKAKKKKRKRRPQLTATQLPMPAADAKMLTREEFCARNRISIPFYNKLKTQGLGPRETRVQSKILITAEADADWRAEREAASGVAAE
jgi:hypothetical protein